jgi:predicted HicB family RNase H-like nuclease
VTKDLEYKGYIGSAEVDLESGTLFGRLLFIRDVIGYNGSTVTELRQAFESAVDDYLATCAEEGDEPDVPCKGSFNVRVGPDLHKEVALLARKRGVSLNDLVCSALENTVRPPARTLVYRHEVTVTYTGQPQAVTGTTAGEATVINAVTQH